MSLREGAAGASAWLVEVRSAPIKGLIALHLLGERSARDLAALDWAEPRRPGCAYALECTDLNDQPSRVVAHGPAPRPQQDTLLGLGRICNDRQLDWRGGAVR